MKKDEEYYVKEINAAWNKSVEGIFKVGELLVEAKSKLKYGDWGKWIEANCPFKERTSRYLIAIYENPQLQGVRQRAAVLPPSWYTLAEIASLSSEEFQYGIDQKLINPDMERSDVAEIKYQYSQYQQRDKIRSFVEAKEPETEFEQVPITNLPQEVLEFQKAEKERKEAEQSVQDFCNDLSEKIAHFLIDEGYVGERLNDLYQSIENITEPSEIKAVTKVAMALHALKIKAEKWSLKLAPANRPMIEGK